MNTFDFSDYTHDLTEDELQLIPLVVSGMKKYRKDNPIKSDLIVLRFNEFLSANNNYKIRKLSSVRLRKLINFIRTTGTQPIIGSSKGYYVSFNQEDINEQILSLKERASSILGCADGLSKFVK